MTRRERLERKLEKREEWATKAAQRSESRLEHAHNMAYHLNGQPILIGHHSEKRHRSHIKKLDNNMRKGIEEADLASHHTSKASGLAHQLKTNIFSDDPDAIENLEAKVEQLEASRKLKRDVNRLFRKGDAEGLEKLGFNLESLKASVSKLDSWQKKQPFASYELSNLGGRITQAKKRIKLIKIREANTAEAETAGGVLINETNGHCSITFAEKPDRAILQELKGAGFWWNGGSWHGLTAKIPNSVET